MNNTTNIALIDRHDIYRKGFKLVLQNMDAVLVAEGNKSEELLSNPEYKKAGLLFIDIGMQCSSCGRNIKEFLTVNPSAKVIGLVQHFDQVRVDDLKEAGINGYLLKNTQRKEIEKAIDAVLSGRFFDPESLRDEILS